MTYKKPLKTFSGTTLMGVSISAVDTATSRIGSDAISAFEAHKTIKTEAENRTMLTPFHAVKKANYGISTEDAERTDPYGCEGSDTKGEVWATITEPGKSFSIKGDGTYEGEGATTSKSFAEWKMLFDSPSDYVVNAITPSQTLSMTYNASDYGGSFETEDGNVGIAFDNQVPDVAIVTSADLIVPTEIIVTKK